MVVTKLSQNFFASDVLQNCMEEANRAATRGGGPVCTVEKWSVLEEKGRCW